MVDLKSKTNEELIEIMRNSIDNSYVPSSIFNKAKLELESRTLYGDERKSVASDLVQKLIDLRLKIAKLIELESKELLERKELYDFKNDAEAEIKTWINQADDETQRHYKKITSGWKNTPKPGYTNPGETKTHLASIEGFVDQTINRLIGRDPKAEVYISAGRPFDGRKQLANVLGTAQKEIFIIDNYLQKSILPILADVAENKKDLTFKFLIGKNDRTKFDGLLADLPDFSKQYPLISIECRHHHALHDRYIIIDKNYLYTVGCSLDSIGIKGNFISIVSDEPSKSSHANDMDSLWDASTEFFKSPNQK